jgi:hypothetical protein
VLCTVPARRVARQGPLERNPGCESWQRLKITLDNSFIPNCAVCENRAFAVLLWLSVAVAETKRQDTDEKRPTVQPFHGIEATTPESRLCHVRPPGQYSLPHGLTSL